MRVLLVDDDFAILDAMRELLQDEGYEVEIAENGQEALTRLRRAPIRQQLILLDLMMPIMNGWQFREEQVRDPGLASIPTVIVSANAPDRYSGDVKTDGFVRKPLNASELLAVVRKHCQAEGLSDSYTSLPD